MEDERNKGICHVTDIHSADDFARIKTGISGEDREVYFARALGAGADDILRLDEAMRQGIRAGKAAYHRLRTLPSMPPAQEVDYYTGCCNNWNDSQQKWVTTRMFDGKDTDAALSGVLAGALAGTVGRYRQIKSGMSETIERNFAVKLLYWFDYVMQQFFPQPSDAKTSYIKQDGKVNMKLAVHNVAKEQEYLFYYMLALAGVDVLLLQSRADLALSQPLQGSSSELVLGNFAEVEVPDFSVMDTQPPQSHPVIAARDLRHPLEAQRGAAGTAAGNGAAQGPIRIAVPVKPGRKTTPPPAQPSPAPRVTPASARPQPVPVHGARAELSYEQLAQLASSVVMIMIHDDSGQPFASGSGIMIGRKGYILTNNHVASGGKFYTVRIENDENCYRAEQVIKYNQLLDLAVIRIDRELDPLPVYKGPQKLVRGQKVVAIGSPRGLFNSVSDGIISGFRKLDDVDMIQFSAPISQGSSGGAVLNMYGEVIGISTLEMVDAQNINMAVGYEFINLFIQGFTG